MQERVIRLAVFAACGLPFAWLAYAAGSGGLGPDPAEQVMHVTGEWALRLLVLTLAASPLRQWFGWRWPLRLRRMLGLYVFFYATLHLLGFLQLYTGWTVAALLEEVVERPYVTAGFVAWVVFLPLALTSTRRAQRALGKRWVALHRLVYVAAIAACLHLLWQARSDIGEALVYSSVFALLLLWRGRRRWSRRRAGQVA